MKVKMWKVRVGWRGKKFQLAWKIHGRCSSHLEIFTSRLKKEKKARIVTISLLTYFFSPWRSKHTKNYKGLSCWLVRVIPLSLQCMATNEHKNLLLFRGKGKKGRWNCEKLLFLLVAVLRCSVNSDIYPIWLSRSEVCWKHLYLYVCSNCLQHESKLSGQRSNRRAGVFNCATSQLLDIK